MEGAQAAARVVEEAPGAAGREEAKVEVRVEAAMAAVMAAVTVVAAKAAV